MIGPCDGDSFAGRKPAAGSPDAPEITELPGILRQYESFVSQGSIVQIGAFQYRVPAGQAECVRGSGRTEINQSESLPADPVYGQTNTNSIRPCT